MIGYIRYRRFKVSTILHVVKLGQHPPSDARRIKIAYDDHDGARVTEHWPLGNVECPAALFLSKVRVYPIIWLPVYGSHVPRHTTTTLSLSADIQAGKSMSSLLTSML